MELPHYFIHCGAYHIGVPQCDETTANVTVAYADRYQRHRPGGMVSYTVSIPSFRREYKQTAPYEMSAKMFDDVVTQNKPEILALISRLNGNLQGKLF